MEKLQIVPLGGLGEVGKNMMAWTKEVNKQSIIILL